MVNTNKNMYIYFLYIFEKSNAFRNELKKILEEYLVGIGKGKRNVLFNNLKEYFAVNEDLSYSKMLHKYIKDFNNNHASFWDKVKKIFYIMDKDD